MRKATFLPAALADLQEIGDYIACDNANAAVRWLDSVFAAIEMLADVPGAGHVRDDGPDNRHRFWLVKSYLIVYRFDDETLTVVRVLHGARNLRDAF